MNDGVVRTLLMAGAMLSISLVGLVPGAAGEEVIEAFTVIPVPTEEMPAGIGASLTTGASAAAAVTCTPVYGEDRKIQGFTFTWEIQASVTGTGASPVAYNWDLRGMGTTLSKANDPGPVHEELEDGDSVYEEGRDVSFRAAVYASITNTQLDGLDKATAAASQQIRCQAGPFSF